MKKLNNKKGFTLMEMLIVVAIIVILVAISIPVFSGQLNNAKKATDLANIRAAKGVATTQYLMSETTPTEDKTYYYNVADGQLVDKKDGIKAYGGSASVVEGATETPAGKILEVTVKTDGTVALKWVEPATTTP